VYSKEDVEQAWPELLDELEKVVRQSLCDGPRSDELFLGDVDGLTSKAFHGTTNSN